MTPARPAGVPSKAEITVLAATLALTGWEVRTVDLDLVAGRAVVEIHRYDGRWLWLNADGFGRASVERWHRRAIVTRYRGGPQCDSSEDDFLGRTRCEGPRAALRHLCGYIADNPAPGFRSLPASDIRDALRPLLRAA
jgi:hypothetical protein